MTTRIRPRAVRALLILAVPAAGLAVFFGLRSGPAVEAGPSAVAAIPAPPALAPGSAAMIARLDQETGLLSVASWTSGLTLDPATANALSRSTEGLVQVIHPDGSVSVDLQGRFQSASVARIDESGTVVVCSDSEGDAAAVLTGCSLPTAEVK